MGTGPHDDKASGFTSPGCRSVLTRQSSDSDDAIERHDHQYDTIITSPSSCPPNNSNSNNNNNNNNNNNQNRPRAGTATTLHPTTTVSEVDNLRLQRTHTMPSPFLLLPRWRKNLIVFVIAFTALPITFASTSLFPLTQEISQSLNSTPGHVQLVNALVLVLMGCSVFVWGPLAKIFGKKRAWLAATVVFAGATAGTALAPEFDAGVKRDGLGGIGLDVFTAMRLISGFEGTFFHIAGQMWIADIFEPVERGTATGFFLIGTVFGPAFGPCFAGIIVTYSTWRSVVWLQVGMSAIGLILSAIFLPDIRANGQAPPSRKARRANAAAKQQVEADMEKGALPLPLPDVKDLKLKLADEDDEDRLTVLGVLKLFNPVKTFTMFLYPNILLTDIACGCMSWSQYTLLASPRHILNPRFGLTSPLVSGLFYIAPGVGFILGTLIGGRYSDSIVRKHIALRNGLRLPQDRLLSGRVAFFVLIPAAQLVYGWCLHFGVPAGLPGGMTVAVIFAMVQAFGLLFAMASLNAFCAEAIPRKRGDVIASKYMVQYGTSALGSAVAVPMIDRVGMGPATTISALLVLIAGCLCLITARWGINMQRWAERKMPRLLAQ